MRTTKTLSITIPPEMLSRAEALAKKENRTMSELVREALRCYERQRWWEEANAYGRARAEMLGIRQEDVDRLIHEYRQEKRTRQKRAPNLQAQEHAGRRPTRDTLRGQGSTIA